MGKLVAFINNKLVIRNFRYITFQFPDGTVYGPFEFEGIVNFTSGEGLPKDGKTLEFIVYADPKFRKRRAYNLQAVVNPIIWIFLGVALIMVISAISAFVDWVIG